MLTSKEFFASSCLVALFVVCTFRICHHDVQISQCFFLPAQHLSSSHLFFLYLPTIPMRQKPSMDALAEIWSRSGQRSEDLYKGTTDEIIKELKAWIVARNVRNETNMRLLWDFFDTNDAISGLQNQSEYLDDLRIAAFKAKHVKSVERVKVREFSLMGNTKH